LLLLSPPPAQATKKGGGCGGRASAVWVLGDSYADTGNLGDLGRALTHAWYDPYGATFPGKPTGRFSDGRVLTDFIGKYSRASFLLRLAPPPHQWRPLMGWIHAFAVGRGSIAISLRINGARPPPSLFGRSANQFPFLLQPAATGRRPVQLASTASAWQSARVQLQRQQCMVGRVARIICDGSTAAGCRRSFSADSRRKVFFFFLDTQYAYYTSVHSKCLLHVFPSRNASKQ
jgi:hypothetical protein